MAEYIDKQAAIRAAQESVNQWDGGYNLNRDAYIEASINNVPPADVRPVVRGRWEEVEVTWLEDVEDLPVAIASMFCPECRLFANHVYHYGNPRYGMNFCPHCGARKGGDAK